MLGQHAEYTMLMSLVLDAEATEAEATQLREHLRSCDSCARTWQRWQELDRRFAVAPAIAAPIDFSLVVAARLDQHVAEQARRRWFMSGLALSWIAAMLIVVVALGLTNGWHLQLIPAEGPLTAAWAGLTSVGGWLFREAAMSVERFGAPTIAAGVGALLCVTCVLGMVWLWLFARLSPGTPRALVSAD